MNEKQFFYYVSIILVASYTLLNVSNWDNSLVLDTSGDSKQFWGNHLVYDSSSPLWYWVKMSISSMIYLGLSFAIYEYTDKGWMFYLGTLILLVIYLFTVSTYLYNLDTKKTETIYTQLHLKNSKNNSGVTYGYKLIYFIGLIILSYKTITSDKKEYIEGIISIIAYFLIGILFQLFGSSILFLFKKDTDNKTSSGAAPKAKWPHMMNYLDKYTDNSNFKEEDKSIISSKRVFNVIGYIRIFLIVLLSGYIANSTFNKDKLHVMDINNITIIGLVLSTSVIFLFLLILSQILISDGCVITRTIDDDKTDINFDNILSESIQISIQNQLGIYFHILIFIIIFSIRIYFNYS